MDKMSLMVILFQSIPESIIILCLGLASIGIKPDFLKVLPAAILSSLISWFVRGWALPFGVHSLVGLITITCLILIFFRVRPIKATIATMFAISVLLSTEAVLLPLVIELTGIESYQKAWGHAYRLFLSLPEQIFLGFVAYLLLKFKISFEIFIREIER